MQKHTTLISALLVAYTQAIELQHSTNLYALDDSKLSQIAGASTIQAAQISWMGNEDEEGWSDSEESMDGSEEAVDDASEEAEVSSGSGDSSVGLAGAHVVAGQLRKHAY